MLLTLTSLIVFLVTLSLLVAAHEWGHYLAARLCKVGVHEFAIGMGRPVLWVWRRTKHALPSGQPYETEFTLRAWPIGGFVRMFGMVPQEDGSEVEVDGGFYQAGPLRRIVIAFAGPLFSIIAGVLLLLVMLVAVGKPVPTTTIQELTADGPAYASGLRPGDTIIQFGSKPVSEFRFLPYLVNQNGARPVEVIAQRGDQRLTFRVTPKLTGTELPVPDPEGNETAVKARQYRLGFSPTLTRVKVPVGEAVLGAVMMPVRYVQVLADRVTKPRQLIEEARSPVGMYSEARSIMKENAIEMIFFAGALSISLGIMNLLPIGMLDGALITIAVIEWFRKGKRLSLQAQSTFATAGMLFLLGMALLVMSKDVLRLAQPGPEPKPALQTMFKPEKPATEPSSNAATPPGP